MNINTISFWFGDAINGIKKNKKSFFTSLGTLIATMIIIALFFIIIKNATYLIEGVEKDQGIVAYLHEINEEQTSTVKGKIESLDEIVDVKYISKEEAFKNQVEEIGEDAAYLLDGREDIYPASFVVKISNLENLDVIKTKIAKIEGVESVSSSDETIVTLTKIAKTAEVVSIAILIILVVVSVLIMMNSIKLTMYARRREISIMKYVGATDKFIRGPIVIEGIIMGLIAALVTILLVNFAYSPIDNGFFMPLDEISDSLFTIFILLGIGIGAVGSSMSMKKYLDV